MAESALPSAVVKVGGSLLDWPELSGRLTAFLTSELDRSNRVVLIAGGGRIVDEIRRLDQVHRFGEVESHWLAIDALALTSRILGRLLPDARVIDDDAEIRTCWDEGAWPILSPGRTLRKLDSCSGSGLPATWDVTSDSIAAWIAEHLAADRLILIKSRRIPPGSSRTQAVAAGFVDPIFTAAARSLGRVDYRNLRDDDGGLIELPDEN